MQDLIRNAILSLVFDELARRKELELAEIYGDIMSGAMSAIATIAKMNADDPLQTVERICTEMYYQVKCKEEE